MHGAFAGGVRVRFLANAGGGLHDRAILFLFRARVAFGLTTGGFGFGFGFGDGKGREPVTPFSAAQTAVSHFDDNEDDDELSDDLSA